MQTDLFRKVSLERLSSPEQLDKLLIIVKLKGWIALICLLVLTLAILSWSFVGKIPLAAEGRGILLDPRGLQGIYSRVEGRVTRIYARTGDEVKKGDILAVMENSLFEIKFNELRHQITSLKKSLKTEEELLEREKKIKEQEFQKKLDLETTILDIQNAKLNLLEQQLESAKSDVKVTLEKEILEQRTIIQTQLTSIELLHTQKLYETTNAKISSLKREISLKEGEFKILQKQQKDLIIKAPSDGRVIEIDVMLGKEIEQGTPMIWLQAPLGIGKTLPFYCFIPVTQGEKIKSGMPAQITLLAIDAQKYGQIIGKVEKVLLFATSLSAQHIAGIPSRVIREYLSADPKSILVVINLEPDPTTPSGYKWTTKKGPPVKEIQQGTIGNARIILESKSPISYALPFFSK